MHTERKNPHGTGSNPVNLKKNKTFFFVSFFISFIFISMVGACNIIINIFSAK